MESRLYCAHHCLFTRALEAAKALWGQQSYCSLQNLLILRLTSLCSCTAFSHTNTERKAGRSQRLLLQAIRNTLLLQAFSYTVRIRHGNFGQSPHLAFRPPTLTLDSSCFHI